MNSKMKGMAFALRAERKKTKMLEEEVKQLREEVYNLTRANDTAWALLEVAGEEE